jgi:hypothetical protein
MKRQTVLVAQSVPATVEWISDVCGARNADDWFVRWQFDLGKAREKMAWPYPR